MARIRNTPAYVALVLLALLGSWSLAERRFILVDDAYIAFRYAANFADGQGLVWNPGERVEGYTNLLWVVLLSVLAKLGVDLTWPAIAASFLFAAGSILIATRLASRGAPEGGRGAAYAPALLLASNASFVNAATSGMESTAFGFFVLFGIHELVRSRGESRLRWLATLGFSAACLTRPEGALVAGVALAVEAVTGPGALTERVKRLVPVGAAVALVVGAHMAARLAYYGYPFPNTFYAKVIWSPLSVFRGVGHLLGFLSAGGFVALFGIGELRQPSELRPWFIHGYVLFAVYSAYLVAIGGDHPHWYRFYVPLLAIPMVASGQWIGRFSANLAHGRKAVSTGFSSMVVVAAAFSSHAFAERRELIIGKITPRERDLMSHAALFFEREIPKGSFVAVAAVGHVGYYARSLHILDMWGLNDVHIAHLDVPPLERFGHDKFDLAYVATRKPDYVYGLLPVPSSPDLPVPPPPTFPGYDLCWPTRYFPAVVYRRNFPLRDSERSLGVSAPATRSLGPPPACEPP